MAESCANHTYERATGRCRECSGPFCEKCLLAPARARRQPLCIRCALVAAGIRTRRDPHLHV